MQAETIVAMASAAACVRTLARCDIIRNLVFAYLSVTRPGNTVRIFIFVPLSRHFLFLAPVGLSTALLQPRSRSWQNPQSLRGAPKLYDIKQSFTALS